MRDGREPALTLSEDGHFLLRGVCGSFLLVGLLWFGFFRVEIGWSNWKKHRRWISESCEMFLDTSV